MEKKKKKEKKEKHQKIKQRRDKKAREDFTFTMLVLYINNKSRHKIKNNIIFRIKRFSVCYTFGTFAIDYECIITPFFLTFSLLPSKFVFVYLLCMMKISKILQYTLIFFWKFKSRQMVVVINHYIINTSFQYKLHCLRMWSRQFMTT